MSQPQELWQGFSFEAVTIQAGARLTAVITAAGGTVPIWQTIRRVGPRAAAPATGGTAPPGSHWGGTAEQMRINIGVTGDTNAYLVEIRAQLDYDPAAATILVDGALPAAVIPGVVNMVRHLTWPYITFDILETSGEAEVEVSGWARVIAQGGTGGSVGFPAAHVG